MRKKMSEMNMSELEEKIKSEKITSKITLALFVIYSALTLIFDLWMELTISPKLMALVSILGFAVILQWLLWYVSTIERRFRLLEDEKQNV